MVIMGLFRKKTPQQAEPTYVNYKTVKQGQKVIVPYLTVESLSLEELQKSDIPDAYLKSIALGGFKNNIVYVLLFGLKPFNQIHVLMDPRKISDKPEKWAKNFADLEDTAKGLQKIVSGRIEDLDDEKNKDPYCHSTEFFILDTEMQMTQKGIAELGIRMREEMNFRPSGLRYAMYRDIVPKDPSTRGLGFNLPPLSLRPYKLKIITENQF
jgi:hypothetical protein